MLDQLEFQNGSTASLLPVKERKAVQIDRPGKTERELPLSVKSLKSKEEIRAHRALWNWPGTRDSDLDLFLYLAETRREMIEPQVFVAYRGHLAEAVLMARLEDRSVPMRLGLLNLRTPRLRVLDVVYGGLRGRPSINKDTVELLVKQVLTSLRMGEADVAIFEPLRTDSGLWEVLQTLPSRFERGFAGTQHHHYRMPLPGSSRHLQESIPSNQRRDYLRKGRKMVRDFSGDVCCRWFCDASPEMYRDLEYVAERSYQRGMGVGFEETVELRGSWDLAASKGWLRVCVLYAGGKPCAFWTGVACCGTLWCDYMAYDRQFASYSPGAYLVLQSFGELSDHRTEHDIREISLGPGDSHLKSLLGCSCHQEKSVYLYAPTPRGAALNTALSFAFATDRAVRGCLERGNPLLQAARRIRRETAIRSTARQHRGNGHLSQSGSGSKALRFESKIA